MKCMSCNNEGHIIKLTLDVEVCLCLDCADVAKRMIARQLVALKMVGRKVDVAI